MSKLDRLLAELAAQMPPAHESTALEGNSGDLPPDPTGRYSVKAVRGGLRDAPVEACRCMPPCGANVRCPSPPVDVEAFHERWRGTKLSDAPLVNRPTAPRGILRSAAGSKGASLAAPAQDDDPELTLPELDLTDSRDIFHQPMQDAPTSAQPKKADPHALCKKEQNKLHIRTIRAEYALTRANAEIVKLRARLAELEGPKQPKKGQRKAT